MKNVFRVLLPLVAIIVFVNLYFIHDGTIQPVDNYPIWMKDASGIHTDQTSGLCYTGMMNGKKIFISADDLGVINRLSINESVNPPEIEIYPVNYSEEIKTLFSKFKKVDMEEIFYDRTNKKIYLSIEGHEYSSRDPQIYRKKEGIYEITYNKDILTFDTILTIRRLDFPKEVYAHTFDNIGFEGFTATDNYYFLGLENFQLKGDEFSDSTLLYVCGRKSDEFHTISTRELKISTICGLYAADDHTLYGIDRNRRNMFFIKFNDDFKVIRSDYKEIDLSIPMHPDINKIIGIAPESITFDENGDVYVATDPWRDFYKPDLAEKKRLSADELKNFADGVPMMYKFKNNFK